MTLVLASSSPRRRELLASIGFPPDYIINPDVNEAYLKNERIREYVQRIAILKARTVHAQVPNAYVVAADTAVELGGKIILKAENKEDAGNLMRRLSGRRHRVYTGVCAIAPTAKEARRTVITRLSLRRLTSEDLADYLESGEWEGKAGAFSIQGRGAKFVKFIAGSYSNVVGLPLYETDCLLKGLGFRG